MKKAFLFPGYGSQFVGMAKDLYDDSRIIQEYFEEASSCLDINFVKLCFASSDTELAQVHAAYAAIFLVSSSIYSLIKDRGMTADILAGYDTGQYAAFYAAGVMSFPDGLYLLNKLAQQYQEFLKTIDVAAAQIDGMPIEELQALCKKVSKKKEQASIALYITETSAVVTGHSGAVETIRQQVCKKKGVRCANADLGIGLHSTLMDSVTESFKMYLEKVDFKDPKISCMNAQAQLLLDGQQVKDEIIASICAPIDWNRIMDSLESYDMIIQVGPGEQLGALAKEKYPDKLVLIIQSMQDLDELAQYVPKEEPDTETP